MLAPCIWVLLAVGFTDDLSSRGRDFFAAESISGLLLLIFSGILFSILAAGPVSPAGPVLAGAAYLGVTVWAFNAPASYASLWAPEVAKEGFDLSRPGYGLAAVLAVPLLGTALSARRWARYEPPVLPIIGEIGRFRGAAKVAGTTVAAEQTTVIRTGVPADRAVPLGTGLADDRTVAINSGAAPADRTAVVPNADRTEPLGRNDRTEVVTNNDRTVFVTQPQSPAAPATPRTAPPAPPAAPRTPPVPVSESEPTTVLALGADEPTVVSGLGLAAPKPAAPQPATPKPVAPQPADPDMTRPLLIPAKATAKAAKPAPADEKTVPAGVTEQTDEKTVPAGVTESADEKTTALNLPTEPTAVIPAQRRPPSIES
ncbi:hypothetical protein Ait01nite_019110 [Actinoplanes italicus]|nr:hypothetical protein Ait01nite_019110 [Actinoplanes italicus]